MNFRASSRLALAAGIVLLLGGCSILSKKDRQADLAWEARRARLELLDRFTLQARVSSGGLFGVKGHLNWRQRPDNFDIRVSGPFGIGAVSIAGTLDHVEIRTAKGSITTPDPEGFLHDKLGWSFPVAHLRYWALGLPSPQSDADLELDDDGRVVALNQDDWKLSYDEYRRAGAVELPRKFEVSNDEVRIKVVVDDWSDLPEP
ncbi:MAG: outer membrane lipoprotein LolB [Gammaproteobacteria bacterium]|nr:outer membrane lipoprotein LolB [Gammaproteobacteria bacterium]